MSNQIRRDDTVGFSLSFLDVLSCGLGAAILLLLVVKHGTTEVPIDDQAFIEQQATRVQNELDEWLAQKSELDDELADSLKAVETAVANKSSLAQAQDQRVADLRAQLAALSTARAELQSAADELKELQAVPTVEPEPQMGSTGHLGGLKVAQSRVVVMLDRSASMLDRSLVEIIRLRLADANTRLASEKWTTARNAAEWAVSQIGNNERFQFVSFSDSVADIASNSISTNQPIGWLQKGSPGTTRIDVRSTLNALHADGPTNLEQAFDVISGLKPRPVQVILVTDGLPTVPEGINLGRIRGCPTPRTNATPILSPRCRKAIFNRAVSTFKRSLPNTEISVVLLPLDGDAQAMFSFWEFAANTGGRVLTPARGWPW